MPSKVPAWERVYVVIVLMTCCRAFDGLLSASKWAGADDQAALSESSPARFAWLTILYGIALALLLTHHRRDLPKLIAQNKLLLAVVVYILASTLWAVDPSTALRRSMAYALTTTFCVYLVLRYPPVDILKLAGWALLLVALISVVAVIFFPEIGRELAGRKLDYWRGICNINTAFGRFMALGILVVWSLRRADWSLQRYDVLVFGLFVVCTYRAHAATALAAVFCAFVSMLLIWSRSPFKAPLPAKLAIAALFGAVMLLTLPFYSSEVLAILQRDDTLTNRVFVWAAAYEQGWRNPIFGVGYESFWIESNAAGAFFNMFGSANTLIGNGHNGYLDAWLELGVVGLAWLALLLVQAFIRLLRYAIKVDDPFGQFYGGLLIFILIYSVAEKVIFMHSELTWILFTTGLVALKWRMTESAGAGRRSTPALGTVDAGLGHPLP